MNILYEEAVKVVAQLFLRTFWEIGGDVVKEIAKYKPQLLGACQKYVDSYMERHGSLKVLGMREPIPLEEVYTDALLQSDQATYRFESISKLEKSYRERGARKFGLDAPSRAGMEVAKNVQYLMILGGPGAGKSTFLRKVGLEALKGRRGQYGTKCIPVFIELKNLSGDVINVKDVIIEEFKACQFPKPENFVESALSQGKLLILLDALDEIPSKNIDIYTRNIQDFVDKYDRNFFIVSCRLAAYKSRFRRFTDIAVADFNDDQVAQFIKNWFRSPSDQELGTAKTCWEVLQKPKNAAAKELAHTPLLLTFLCLVYDRSQTFPDNRSGLYRKALRILLEEWAAEKRILRDQIYKGLSIEQEEILLANIALRGFLNDNLFFHKRDITEHIKDFLENNLNAPDNLDSEAVLDAIAIQQGILVKRAEDIYSFSHLTLQEYLTAQYIDDYHRTEQLVEQYLTNERWREVFLLVSGLLRAGSDALLASMAKQLPGYADTPTLQFLLDWANQITSDETNGSSSLAKRATAIFLSLNIVRNHHLNLALMRASNRVLLEARVFDFSRILEIIRDFDMTLSYQLSLISLFSDSRDSSLISVLEPFKFRDLDFLSTRLVNNAVNLREIYHSRAVELSKKIKETSLFGSNIEYEELISKLQNSLNVCSSQLVAFNWLPSKKMLGSNQVPNRKVIYKNYADEIFKIWLDALNLDVTLLELSVSDSSKLHKYCYISELIVRCKQVSMQVSPQRWHSIEDRLFKPITN